MPPSRPDAFLVFTGYNLRGVIAFCRALKRDGRRFAIIACTNTDPIFRTSLRNQVIATREHRSLEFSDIERCIRNVQTIKECTLWYIAPSSEFLVRWCLDRREDLLALGCELPLPDRDIYLAVSDKRPFAHHCRSRGLATPMEGNSPEEIGLPCVAKPIVNVTSDGRSLYPWLLHTPLDVTNFRKAAKADEFFFQEWIEGQSIYLLVHLDRFGKATCFSQRNLAQQPGGKSVVLAQASAHHLTTEASYWIDALRATGFFGIAMIELRIRAGGQWVLIETNPRLWGPLQLVVDAKPMLLDTYFETLLGPSTKRQSKRPNNRAQWYLWYGGARSIWNRGEELVWHIPRPSHLRWLLLRLLPHDVYFRWDTWRYFFSE